MPYPLSHERAAAALPSGPRALGPDAAMLFHCMPIETALACAVAGRLLPTRDNLSRPGSRILGIRSLVLSRLERPMPPPYLGTVADAVPLTFTPHTTSVFASCGRDLQDGAERVARDEVVVAVVPLADLLASGLPFLFCDRNPMGERARMAEAVDLHALPWDRFRARSFGKGSDPEGHARYGAEVLVWMGVPLALVAQFCVLNERSAEAFNAEAAALGRPGLFTCRTAWHL